LNLCNFDVGQTLTADLTAAILMGFIGLHLYLDKLSGNISLFVESTSIRNLIRFSFNEDWVYDPYFPFDIVARQYRNLEIVCVYSPCNADIIINILARFCPDLRRVEIRILNVSESEVVALRTLLNLFSSLILIMLMTP
jgi:hypothetical protein